MSNTRLSPVTQGASHQHKIKPKNIIKSYQSKTSPDDPQVWQSAPQQLSVVFTEHIVPKTKNKNITSTSYRLFLQHVWCVFNPGFHQLLGAAEH